MSDITIDGRKIGQGHPCFVIAEISANHGLSFEKAERLVRIAKECGADAVKLQTYTADTITLNCDNEYFRIKEGPWAGQRVRRNKTNHPKAWCSGRAQGMPGRRPECGKTSEFAQTCRAAA